MAMTRKSGLIGIISESWSGRQAHVAADDLLIHAWGWACMGHWRNAEVVQYDAAVPIQQPIRWLTSC